MTKRTDKFDLDPDPCAMKTNKFKMIEPITYAEYDIDGWPDPPGRTGIDVLPLTHPPDVGSAVWVGCVCCSMRFAFSCRDKVLDSVVQLSDGFCVCPDCVLAYSCKNGSRYALRDCGGVILVWCDIHNAPCTRRNSMIELSTNACEQYVRATLPEGCPPSMRDEPSDFCQRWLDNPKMYLRGYPRNYSK